MPYDMVENDSDVPYLHDSKLSATCDGKNGYKWLFEDRIKLSIALIANW